MYVSIEAESTAICSRPLWRKDRHIRVRQIAPVRNANDRLITNTSTPLLFSALKDISPWPFLKNLDDLKTRASLWFSTLRDRILAGFRGVGG